MSNEEEKYYVYMHINKIDGKKYIGITKNYKKRWQNGNGYSGQRRFYYAIRKYGWNNFKHVILEKNLTLEEAYEKEKEYIKKYDSMYNGYNISEGGANQLQRIGMIKREVEFQVKKNLENSPTHRMEKVVELAVKIGYKLTREETDVIFNYYYKGNEYKEDFLKLKKKMEEKMRENARQKKVKEEYLEELRKIYAMRKKGERIKKYMPLIQELNKKYENSIEFETIF